MAIKLKCRCGERLSAPESAVGKKGKCSKCGMTFVIPTPTPTVASATPKTVAKPAAEPTAKPLEEDDFGLSDFGDGPADLETDLDDFLAEETHSPTHNPFLSPATMSTPAPAPMKSTGNTRAQMNTLANGIKLVFWGTASLVIAWFVMVAGFLVNTAIVVLAGPVIALLGIVVATVGRVVCLGGPSKAAGRSLLIGSVVCDLINLTSAVLVITGVAPPAINPISSLLGLFTLILFVLFIESLARSIGQPHLADDANAIIILIATTIALIIATALVAVVFPLLVIATVLGILVSGLWGFFKYLNLLQHTAEAVRC